MYNTSRLSYIRATRKSVKQKQNNRRSNSNTRFSVVKYNTSTIHNDISTVSDKHVIYNYTLPLSCNIKSDIQTKLSL